MSVAHLEMAREVDFDVRGHLEMAREVDFDVRGHLEMARFLVLKPDPAPCLVRTIPSALVAKLGEGF